MYTITVLFCLLLGYGLGRRDAKKQFQRWIQETNAWNDNKLEGARHAAFLKGFRAAQSLPYPLDRGANLLIPTDET